MAGVVHSRRTWRPESYAVAASNVATAGGQSRDHGRIDYKGTLYAAVATNVQMVLVSVSESTPLEELAILADKIREVATPFVAAVTVPSQATSEIEQLRVENVRLQQQISALQAATGPRQHLSPSRNRGQSRSP